jgi:hypothetical protein
MLSSSKVVRGRGLGNFLSLAIKMEQFCLIIVLLIYTVILSAKLVLVVTSSLSGHFFYPSLDAFFLGATQNLCDTTLKDF